MISILEAMLLGIVQGLTEWLPISSSGHLVIVQDLLGLKVPVVFDLMLHIATLLVLLVFYYKDILRMSRALLRGDFRSRDGKLGLMVMLATIPIVIAGLIFRDWVESAFSSTIVVGFALLFTALLLFFSERMPGKKKITSKDAFAIGVMQAVALIPGVSRSGSTISTALMLGIEKKEAARFSFLIFIPAVLGALVLKSGDLAFSGVDPAAYLVGMISAFAVGYAALTWLLGLVVRKRFHLFSYYCFALGIIVLFLSYA